MRNKEKYQDIFIKSLSIDKSKFNTDIKYNEDCAAEDFELWIQLSEKTEFYMIPDVLMKIRIDKKGLSQRNKQNCELSQKRIIKQKVSTQIDYNE